MQQSQSGEAKIFQQLLAESSNSMAYKEVIADVAKTVEQRTFWYFTSDEAGFLNKVYDKQLDRQVLKKRIQKITDQKMDELVMEILSGEVKKINQDRSQDSLQVQLGLKQLYQGLPSEDERIKQGQQKVKLINEDLKKYKEQMDEKRRLIESRKHEKEALQAQFKKSIQKEKREQYRADIRKHIQNLKKKEQERKEDNQKFKAFFKQYKKVKPLHTLMEEVYKQKVVLPALEESRKKIQSLSHKKKPTLEQINDHDRLYIASKQSRPEKIIMLNNTIDVSYKSQFYKNQEEKQLERRSFEQTGPSWDFLEKQKRYSQFVKDKVKPRISKQLKESLDETIKQSHHHIESPDRSRVIQVGKNYLQYMRSLQKKRRSSTPIQAAQTVKQSRYFNYLDQLKSKSEHHTSRMDWEKDMNNRASSKMERREKVLMKSKQLQEKAMRDEKVIAHYSYNRAEEIISRKKEIDQTLLSSIKAKVAVLKDANTPD